MNGDDGLLAVLLAGAGAFAHAPNATFPIGARHDFPPVRQEQVTILQEALQHQHYLSGRLVCLVHD